MKKSEKYIVGTIPQYIEKLDFSRQGLIDRLNEYLEKEPDKLYRAEIIANDRCTKSRDSYLINDSDYLRPERDTFANIIAENISDQKLTVKVEDCNYSSGNRAKKLNDLQYLKHDMAAMKKYYNDDSVLRKEDRMVHCICLQGNVDGYEAVDFQVPTRTGGHDKIDLILRKDDTVYVTEVKKFESNESMLRCVLEISTYHKKINEKFYKKYNCNANTVKRAVLINEESYAYYQLTTPTRYLWVVKLLKEFNVTVLILSEDGNKFHIAEYKY